MLELNGGGAIDSRLAMTGQNAAAARLLTAARRVAGMNQTQFAAEIGRRLGLPPFSQSALSAWETSQRSVPAPVLLAAVEIAHESGVICVLPPGFIDADMQPSATIRSS